MTKRCGVAALVWLGWWVLVAAGAGQTAQAGPRSLKSHVTKVVSVTGVVQPSPQGLVLKSAAGRYALAGRDLSSYLGQKVIVSGTVQTAPAEKGPRRVLSVTRVEPVEEKKTEPGHTSP